MGKSRRGADGTLGRRAFLAGAVGMPFVLAGRGLVAAEPEARPFPGLIALQRDPDNLQYPFASLDGFLTPTEHFYVRNHFPVPEVDAKAWKLRVEGAVEKPFEIGYDELRALPSHTLTALLECAGNGRVFLKPPQIGLRWELGGVGTAEWTGVRLADVLARAGLKDNAVDVVLEGADRGEVRPPFPATPGVIPFARSLPLAKARRPEVLLAYRMNGKDLTAAHGFPVRAVVPGWYGMASVKWLTRVAVTDRPFDGYFQTFQYAIWDRRHGQPSLVPVADLQVKAQVARPAPFEIVPRGVEYRVFGAAWTGDSEVTRVEVSTDGGKSWTEAKLLDKPVPFAWRLWEATWKTPAEPGRRTVLARATDARGRTQPRERDPDWRDSMISHVLPIPVEVR